MGQRVGYKTMWCVSWYYYLSRTGKTVVCFPAPLKEKKTRAGFSDKPVALSWMWLLLEDAIMLLTGRSPQGRRTRSWSAQRSHRADTHRGCCKRGCSLSQCLDHGYGWHIGKHFLVSMWLNHVTSECHSERNAEGAARRLVRLVVAFRKRWIMKMTDTRDISRFIYTPHPTPPPKKPKTTQTFPNQRPKLSNVTLR